MIYFLTQDDLNNMPRAKETDKVIILWTKKNVTISAEIFAKLIKGKFRGYEVITTSTKKEIEEIVTKKSKGKDFKIIGDSIKAPVAAIKEVKKPAATKAKKASPKAAEKPAKTTATASKTKAVSAKKVETTKKSTKTNAKKAPAKKTTSKKK